MNTSKAIVAILACLFVRANAEVPAHADDTPISADMLRHMCAKTTSSSQNAYCIGYLDGFVSGNVVGRMEALAKMGKASVGDLNAGLNPEYSLYCPRPDVTSKQLAKMFIKYMDDHPEWLDHPVEAEVTSMLIHYFPCKAETNATGDKR